MNKTIYKSFGILLMVLTFVFVVTSLFKGYTQYAGDLYNFAINAFYPIILVFIFGFFPGLFFYRFGKDNNESNKIVKSALILQIISLVIALFLYTISLSCGVGCDKLTLIGPMFILGLPALILYGIGILLLIIYKFKTRSFKLRLL